MPANSEAQAAKMQELVIHSNAHMTLSEMDTAMIQCLLLYWLDEANLANATPKTLGRRLWSVRMHPDQCPSPEMGHEFEVWGGPAN